MSRLPLFVIIASLAIAFPAAALGEGPSSSISIGSETVIVNVNSTHPGFQDIPLNFTSDAGENITSHGALFFEARIWMNDSAFMVPAITVETNATGKSEQVHNVTAVSVYSSPSGAPIVYSGPVDLQGPGNNHSESAMSSDPLPIIIPRGGMLGMTFEIFGVGDGDQVRVTFKYIANAGSKAVTEIVPVVDVSLNPLDVSAAFGKIETAGDNLTANGAFSDPETHCELCAKMTYEPRGAGAAEASYAGSRAHISGASNVTFWARGEEGGETATFKAAGAQAMNGTVAYANSTHLTLDKEWRMYAIGLPEEKLYGVSRPFSVEFAADNSQTTIYLKGITYN